MKRTFIALVLVILSCLILFSFVACKDNGEEENPQLEETNVQSTFYSLEEAYENGLISKDDLRSIAYHYNSADAETDFVPIPKSPESLSEETVNKIKRAYYDKVGGENLGATVDDVYIGGYYGTYAGCVVVMLGGDCMSGFGGDPIYYPEYMIDDIVFYWYTPLKVWKEISI